VNYVDPSGLEYVDVNITGGPGIVGTAGYQFNDEGVAGYVGGGIGTPGAGVSISYSDDEITPGLSVGVNVGGPGFAAQIGYSFGKDVLRDEGVEGVFTEVGIGGGTPGAAITAAWVSDVQ
jgi:hypothetical protein